MGTLLLETPDGVTELLWDPMVRASDLQSGIYWTLLFFLLWDHFGLRSTFWHWAVYSRTWMTFHFRMMNFCFNLFVFPFQIWIDIIFIVIHFFFSLHFSLWFCTLYEIMFTVVYHLHMKIVHLLMWATAPFIFSYREDWYLAWVTGPPVARGRYSILAPSLAVRSPKAIGMEPVVRRPHSVTGSEVAKESWTGGAGHRHCGVPL